MIQDNHLAQQQGPEQFNYLVEQFIANGALTTIIRHFSRDPFLLGHHMEIESAGYDALLKCREHYDPTTGEEGFMALGRRAVFNNILTYKRSLQVRARPRPASLAKARRHIHTLPLRSTAQGSVSLESITNEGTNHQPLEDWRTGTEEGTFTAETQEEIAVLLKPLREPYLGTFYLFAVENHSHQEIAEELQLPRGTVMSRIFRARAILREALTPKSSNGT